MIDLSVEVRRRRRGFFVDNGNFVEIGRIRKQLQSEAKELYKKVGEFETKVLGRSVRNRELPKKIQAQYLALATQVKIACDNALLDDEENAKEHKYH